MQEFEANYIFKKEKIITAEEIKNKHKYLRVSIFIQRTLGGVFKGGIRSESFSALKVMITLRER